MRGLSTVTRIMRELIFNRTALNNAMEADRKGPVELPLVKKHVVLGKISDRINSVSTHCPYFGYATHAVDIWIQA